MPIQKSTPSSKAMNKSRNLPEVLTGSTSDFGDKSAQGNEI